MEKTLIATFTDEEDEPNENNGLTNIDLQVMDEE